MSWEDAMLFCRWLTEKELKSGRLKEGEFYRLPTAEEWDQAVGIEKEKVETVSATTGAESGAGEGQVAVTEQESAVTYPWGNVWPPPFRVENYGQKLAVDPFVHTAPVGSFAPNVRGFYDLGGNVREWCMDNFSQSENLRVLRGASWRMNSASDLRSDAVVGNASDLRFASYGFRCVLDQSGKILSQAKKEESVEVAASSAEQRDVAISRN
ncbi:MAG: formylglycine-generating enzyme family protein [Blastochloris sp.]|nr:formylglycine-generating enzyme family protein [Blastochloris sp.]